MTARRPIPTIAFAAVLATFLAIGAGPAGAVDHPVTANDDLTFTPEVLVIDPGDTVTWSNTGGLHNVIADDGSFHCANGCDETGGNGTASSGLWSFTLPFPDPENVGYHCEIHGSASSGMYGVVIVALFRDGFETGDSSRWSSSVGAPTNDLAPAASGAIPGALPGLTRQRTESAADGVAKHCTGAAGK